MAKPGLIVSGGAVHGHEDRSADSNDGHVRCARPGHDERRRAGLWDAMARRRPKRRGVTASPSPLKPAEVSRRPSGAGTGRGCPSSPPWEVRSAADRPV